MFFAEKITLVKEKDRVLEVGPGSTPHPRSDVYLEKVFQDEEEFRLQRGNTDPIAPNDKTVFYEGGKFPFKDKEFDYVICSHVLEHVDDPEEFLKEVFRVAKRGYLEFPTSYYDFVYNIPVHKNLILLKNGIIHWMPKSEAGFERVIPFQHFMFETLKKEYFSFVNSLRDYFVQGTEYTSPIPVKRVTKIEDVCYDPSVVAEINKYEPKVVSLGLKKEANKKLRRMLAWIK